MSVRVMTVEVSAEVAVVELPTRKAHLCGLLLNAFKLCQQSFQIHLSERVACDVDACVVDLGADGMRAGSRSGGNTCAHPSNTSLPDNHRQRWHAQIRRSCCPQCTHTQGPTGAEHVHNRELQDNLPLLSATHSYTP